MQYRELVPAGATSTESVPLDRIADAHAQHGIAGARFAPLASETRTVLPTDCAAFHLNRRPQTLREWACLDRGLLRPVRIGNRLGWRTADIRRILGVAE